MIPIWGSRGLGIKHPERHTIIEYVQNQSIDPANTNITNGNTYSVLNIINPTQGASEATKVTIHAIAGVGVNDGLGGISIWSKEDGFFKNAMGMCWRQQGLPKFEVQSFASEQYAQIYSMFSGAGGLLVRNRVFISSEGHLSVSHWLEGSNDTTRTFSAMIEVNF